MLVLTRYRGESITIGDQITVTVLGIQDQQVRLGIEAPARTSVHRKEVFERIRRENKSIRPPD